jgi:hypothetical protein
MYTRLIIVRIILSKEIASHIGEDDFSKEIRSHIGEVFFLKELLTNIGKDDLLLGTCVSYW